jgi:aryl-alcohol dehydrogenase-like predicted oxidoreductase
VLARVPLASGFLSGKYKPGHPFPAGDVRADRDQRSGRCETQRGRADRQRGSPARRADGAVGAGMVPAPSVVHCVIPGCKDVQQVRDNAAAAELVQENRARIDSQDLLAYCLG